MPSKNPDLFLVMNDYEMQVLSQGLADELWAMGCAVAMLDQSVQQIVIDKYRTAVELDRHGIPTSATYLTVAQPRIVHRDGIHFQGLRYISPLLAAYVKEPVVIRYDPRDISEIRVFHKGQYICKAVNPEHASATVSLKDIQAARSARRRQLRG